MPQFECGRGRLECKGVIARLVHDCHPSAVFPPRNALSATAATPRNPKGPEQKSEGESRQLPLGPPTESCPSPSKAPALGGVGSAGYEPAALPVKIRARACGTPEEESRPELWPEFGSGYNAKAIGAAWRRRLSGAGCCSASWTGVLPGPRAGL
jgi:hypothetical protein